MKITDAGFKHILSIGTLKASSQSGIYYLYSWEGVSYYCGPKNLEVSFNQNGVYIQLNAKQQLLLPNSKKPLQIENAIKKIIQFYESALFMEYSREEHSFKTQVFDGLLINLKHLVIDSKVPSPFRIIEQTRTIFHGFYAPLSPLNELFLSLGLNTNKLWITGAPVVKGDEFTGILVGLSVDQKYGLDILELFKDCTTTLKVA